MGPAIATNQITNRYFDLYREEEVTFSKDVIKSLRLDPRQVYVKCGGGQWPCIINSTSFQKATIIIGTAGGAYQKITKTDAPPVSIRYCFIEENGQPLNFFVNCKSTEVTPYGASQDLAIVTLTFTQRPPDDLIIKLGTLIDANATYQRRKSERVIINENTKRLLGIAKKESIIFIENVPRRCVLWDLSFSGTKIIIMGLPNFLNGKDCLIRLMFSEPNQIIDVRGKISNALPIEGRKDLATAGIDFYEETIPIEYKIRITNFFFNNKKTMGDATKTTGNTDPTKIVTSAKEQQEKAKEQEQAKDKSLENMPKPEGAVETKAEDSKEEAKEANTQQEQPAQEVKADAQTQENADTPSPDSSPAPEASPSPEAPSPEA